MEQERRLQSLDTAIERGIADAEAGRVQSIDDVRENMRKRLGESEFSASA
jgi:antitoxin ParD1/3/4